MLQSTLPQEGAKLVVLRLSQPSRTTRADRRLQASLLSEPSTQRSHREHGDAEVSSNFAVCVAALLQPLGSSQTPLSSWAREYWFGCHSTVPRV